MIAFSPPILFASAGVIVAILLVLIAGAGILWLVLGPGPRRSRAWKRAAQLANSGQWQEALELARSVRAAGSPQASWQRAWAGLEGSCLQAGAETLLREKRYEESLNLYREAAPLLETSEQAV